jgi:GNAT superfamily N-acetyltransferase
LELLKELGELKSPEEEHLIETSTRDYLNTALSKNEFISYMVEKKGVPVSISGMVLFRGKGLARRLLEECINECKKSGVKRIWLHASRTAHHYIKK